MAASEFTSYFDNILYDSLWSNSSNIAAGSNNTYANTTVYGTNYSKFIGIDNIHDTSSTWSIAKVEIGIEYYFNKVDGKIRNHVKFKDGSSSSYFEDDSDRTTDSIYWFDITNDSNAPSIWSWDEIENLEVYTYAAEHNSDFNATVYIDSIQIKVTEDITVPTSSSKKLKYCEVTTGANSSLDSDNFNDNSLDTGIWTLNDYDNGGSSTLSETNNQIEISSSSGSSQYNSGEKTISQSAGSTASAYDVQVKCVDITTTGSASDYGGLQIGSGVYLQIQGPSKLIYWDGGYTSYSNLPIYLKFTFDGKNTAKGYTSTNGTSWTLRFTDTGVSGSTVNDINVFGGCMNYDGNSGTSLFKFDDFVNNSVTIEDITEIQLYEDYKAQDELTEMNYYAHIYADSKHLYAQLTTSFSHDDMTDLRIRKDGTTYGFLSAYDGAE